MKLLKRKFSNTDLDEELRSIVDDIFPDDTEGNDEDTDDESEEHKADESHGPVRSLEDMEERIQDLKDSEDKDKE